MKAVQRLLDYTTKHYSDRRQAATPRSCAAG